MSEPFFQLSLQRFYLLLDCYPLKRVIDSIHMHHTWVPNHSQYTGEPTIQAIYRAHLDRGFTDIAEHITIAPDGTIWTGRNWDLPPASAVHFNGTSQSGPFMFETIGNFDLGQDPFDGVQRDTVLKVLTHLIRRFNLPLDQVRFHNQMTKLKSCPGTSIQRAQVLRDVSALLDEGDQSQSSTGIPPATSSGTADLAFIRNVIASMQRRAAAGRGLDDGELDYDFQAKTAFFAVSSPEANLMDFDSRDVGSASGPSPAGLQVLRPYTVNMRWGKFAEGDGHLLQTGPGDVDAMVHQYLPAAFDALGKDDFLDILLYAHGGLVSEAVGLQEALTALQFFCDNKIYPIFFIWETGLWETIQGLITGQAEAETRDLGGVADAIRNKAIEFAAHYVLPGPTVWGGMKWDADRSSQADGAAYYFAQGLMSFLSELGEKADRVRIHACGHSAGAIFHSYLLPALKSLGLQSIHTLHLLAPAIRIDSYLDRLKPLVGQEIKDVTMYTMVKPRELADTCKKIYGHSLLYLIRNALEDVVPTPILGLEESIRSDQTIAAQFGLSGVPNPAARIIWSPTKANTGLDASQCICHGGFHDDPATMGSLVRRVKHWPATEVIQEFRNSGDICPDAGNPRALIPTSFRPTPQFGFAASQRTAASSPAAGSGQRLALCIGIDQYPAPNTLSGCVGDARAWQQALSGMGFSVKMLLDTTATFEAMVAAMTDFVSSGRAGDTLIFQYSGHGTEVINPDRAAGDGELAGQDEAFVPVDFTQQGGFLIDRQVRSIFDKLANNAQLTCFVDCCHSATISRMAIGAAATPSGNSVRGRYIPFTAQMARAYQDFQSRTVSSSVFPPGLRSAMRHVVFSACRAEEVAYERNGRGDFSRLTIPLLSGAAGSNSDFQALVLQAFGPNPAQHPVLDCADPWLARPIFWRDAASDPTSAVAPAAARGTDLQDFARRLRGLADLIG